MKHVNMCHGSRNRIETTNHITYVEARETINWKKIVFWKIVANVKPSLIVVWIDLTVMKTDANMRYVMIMHQKYTMDIYHLFDPCGRLPSERMKHVISTAM